MFEKVMYLSIFYCLSFVKEISANVVEEQVTEEKDPDLEGEENFRVYYDREEYQK